MKKWYQSKTIWFNVLTVVVVVATFFGYTPNQEIAEMTSSVLLGLSPAINFFLRLITDKKIV